MPPVPLPLSWLLLATDGVEDDKSAAYDQLSKHWLL
jgi:hypothetical protein